MNDLVGQQLGNYRLMRLLGYGGSAEVYLGEHVHLGTSAAIKVLKTRLTSKEIEQFRDEARTLVRLEHPNIVRVLEFGIENGTPFLVMNYAPKGSVRHRFGKGSRVPLSTIVIYVNQVASALQHAHNQKLIHRDVKPENMLLGQNEEILLSDFGIAVVSHSIRSQRTEDVVGTPIYMAPEQFEGKPTTASDQYALGIAVYEWLCGVCPFQGAFYDLYAKHKSMPPPPLDNIPAATPFIKGVIFKALEKNPYDRFASVQEFAYALEQAYQEQVNPPMQPTVPVSYVPTLLPLSPTEGIQQQAPTSPSLGKLLLRYSGHSLPITGLAWSPDGTHIATTSKDGTMQVWNVADRSNLFSSSFDDNRKRDYMTTLAWSPDGRFIAVSCSNGTMQVWDILRGKEYASYTGGQNTYGDGEQMNKLVWSPDGNALAFRSFFSVRAKNAWGNTVID